MSEPAEKMVLRTVYLPPALDEKLRVQAFRSKVSKNDLMRRAIERELAEVPEFGKEPANPPRKTMLAKSTSKAPAKPTAKSLAKQPGGAKGKTLAKTPAKAQGKAPLKKVAAKA